MDTHLSPVLSPLASLSGLPSVASVRRDPRLDALVRREVIEAGVASTAAIAWARRAQDAQEGWRVSLGEVVARDVSGPPVFDLASVTKPLTATVAAALVGRGQLAWDACVAELLPELAGSEAASATLGALLSHRAGMPAWGALYRRDPWGSPVPASLPPDDASILSPTGVPVMLLRAASRREHEADAVYSDVGYVLAGAAIARALGAPLASGWRAVTGIRSAGALRDEGVPLDRFAPTEASAWRGVVRGEVHDENAWALERAGGDPGHAGAFATVDEVCAFAIRFQEAASGRDASPIVPTAIARAMIVERPGGSHRLGWDARSGAAPSSGARFGPATYGHLGFTGASVWIDPEAEAIAVLLTNRTFPTRDNLAIRTARPRVHDALWSIAP